MNCEKCVQKLPPEGREGKLVDLGCGVYTSLCPRCRTEWDGVAYNSSEYRDLEYTNMMNDPSTAGRWKMYINAVNKYRNMALKWLGREVE